MVVTIGIIARLMRFGIDVNLASNHRMHALRFSSIVEFHCTEQVAMIGHSHCGHLLLHRQIHQLRDFASAVKQGVIGVAMQMDERCVGHGWKSNYKSLQEQRAKRWKSRTWQRAFVQDMD